jgi:transposase-like protein
MPMRQLLSLARLRFGEQRSYSEIAASLGVARSTVQAAVARFGQAGLSWPLPPDPHASICKFLTFAGTVQAQQQPVEHAHGSPKNQRTPYCLRVPIAMAVSVIAWGRILSDATIFL